MTGSFVSLPRAAALSVAFSVLVPSIAAAQAPAPQTSAALTPVQVVFVNHRPLSMWEAAPDSTTQTRPSAVTNLPGQAEGLTASRQAVDFKPTRLSRVFFYSLELMFYEHVLRVATQADSRSELGGPFFQDWFDSVHVPRKWGDGDHWQVNYIGHAINGAAAARIWLDQREPQSTSKKQYLASVGRALVFATIFSELFENGPLSEASIGNVSRRADRTGWVDHVWTPIGGMLWAMAEDAIDKYVLTQVDKRVPSLIVRAAARMILNPGRMFANVSQNRVPWNRPDRRITAGMTGRR